MSRSTQAQTPSAWPKAKPVTLLVAFAPGASTDIVACSLTQKLSDLTDGNFVVEKLNAALNRAMASPEVVGKFAQLGMVSTRNSSADFGNFLRAEVPK